MAPTITIATRTQNRTELLSRVRLGLVAQSRKDFEWVILNDGGDPGGVQREAEAARAEGLDVHIHHNAQPSGRSAAANAVVRKGAGRFVLLHDDDDVIASEFLEKTAGLLETHPNLVGAVTWMLRITERWSEGAGSEEVERRPFEEPFDTLYLADMAMRNRFAPIAFLYRRDAFEAVGGYDETMDLLEDWDFNLRMMLRGDIGVVPEALAHYYIRTNVADSRHRMANTVHAREKEHWSSHATFHNKLLRADLTEGRIGLGMLLAMARLVEPAHHTQHSMERLKQALDRVGLRSLWRSFHKKS